VPPATPYPGPTGRNAVERDLIRRASAFECEPWRNTNELAFEQGAMGAIWCGSPARRVAQLAIYSFPSPTELATFWPLRLADIEALPLEVDSPCSDGEPGLGTWASGDIVCYVEDGKAKIRWTDRRSGMYALVDATDRNLRNLYTWWRQNGRRLGFVDRAD